MLRNANDIDPNDRQVPSCACGGAMARDMRPMEFTFCGQSITLDQPGWYCTKCGENVLSVADALVTEPAFMALKATMDATVKAADQLL